MPISSYNASPSSFFMPVLGMFSVSFSSIFALSVLSRFFSTSSLKNEDLRRRLSAVGGEDDDLGQGVKGSVLISVWKMPCFFGMSKSSGGKGLDLLKIDRSVV